MMAPFLPETSKELPAMSRQPRASMLSESFPPVACRLGIVAWTSLFAGLSRQPMVVAAGPVFQGGFAERDSTPPVGSEMPGNYGKSYHQFVHDPCRVRAAVFDDGSTRAARVGLDALYIHRQTVDQVRKAI